jgi:hypothetical protein
MGAIPESIFKIDLVTGSDGDTIGNDDHGDPLLAVTHRNQPNQARPTVQKC